jgi:hypothetical protein
MQNPIGSRDTPWKFAEAFSSVSRMDNTHDFEKLLAFVERLPAIDLPAGRKSIGGLKADFRDRWMIWNSGKWTTTEAAHQRLNLTADEICACRDATALRVARAALSGRSLTGEPRQTRYYSPTKPSRVRGRRGIDPEVRCERPVLPANVRVTMVS